ncbi:MAG: DUF2138 domain-containing protein [Pseudomonadota bacterium]
MSDNTSPEVTPVEPSGAAAAADTGPRKRRVALLVLGLLGAGLVSAAGAFFAGFFEPQTPRELAEQSLLELDLSRPDALIESDSLSRLPRDLLSVPLLRDSLTEDFVFYYEGNPDRLGLGGSLRRIIYEHDLQLQDSLLDELLDQPAQVALWRGVDGKLKHFLLLLDRGGLARLLEPLAHVAADDSQLRPAGELQVDGEAVPLYRLRYNGQRSLLLASHGDKLLVLSNPGMLLDGEYDGALLAREATERVEALLNGDNPFAERFGLESRGEVSQRISLGAETLALGYQRFIPAFAGLRFEMDAQGWHSFLALNDSEDRTSLDFAPVWRAMPMGASACVALPVATGVHEKMLAKLGTDEQVAKGLAGHLTGAAGLCWYPDSRLHSPLLVGLLDDSAGASLDGDLGKLFDSLIGAGKPRAEPGEDPSEAAGSESQGDSRIWQREVSSKAADSLFRVTLARHGSTLLFSLDDGLVDKAINTLGKRFPPLAEVLPKDALVPVYLAPETLAVLLEQETLDSLPADMEPVFRNAAQAHLLPKLKALAGHRGYALTLPAETEVDGPWQWLPLEWRGL